MTEDLHELSALYALDVLDVGERARFEAHLAECERCQEELGGLRLAAGALAYAEEGPVPAPALRGRILAAARAEPQNVVSLRSRRSAVVSIAVAVAVAATAAAVGIGIWAASLQGSLASERAATKVLRDPLARHVAVQGSPGELVIARSGEAVLNVDLPDAPAGRTYEAWVADPVARPAGLFDGRTTRLAVRVRPGARVMVTLERDGGAATPSRRPLLLARA